MNDLIVVCSLTVLLMVTFVRGARSGDMIVELRYVDHHFVPLRISVPANEQLRIRVVNASKETIEFESFRLNREKVIGPGETAIVFLPALSAGSYDFYDDFHQDVPEGVIVAK